MQPPRVLANDFRAEWRAIRAEALAAVDRVGESGWWILGEEVAAFERELAAYQDVPFTVGTANGLDALEIAMRCAGVRAGDIVLTTPLTAFATTLAIVRLGARPAFVDVDGAGLIDLDRVERVLAERRDIRALLPVHLYGHALDVARLQSLGERYGVQIVEDCAQAIGARHAGRPVGSASRAAATSFYPTKNLGCMGDGGAIFVADAEARDLARTLRDYGQSAKYVHDQVGLNSRLDEVQAAILRSALLPRLAEFTERRRTIARAYLDGIRNPSIRFVDTPVGSESAWHLFPVLVDPREPFLDHLKKSGVAGGIHYPGLTSDQRALDGVASEQLDPLERARTIARTEASLPIHPFLDDASVAWVIETCNAYRPG